MHILHARQSRTLESVVVQRSDNFTKRLDQIIGEGQTLALLLRQGVEAVVALEEFGSLHFLGCCSPVLGSVARYSAKQKPSHSEHLLLAKYKSHTKKFVL